MCAIFTLCLGYCLLAAEILAAAPINLLLRKIMVPFRTRRVSTRFLIMTWKRPLILRLRENGEGWLTIKPRCLKPPLRKQVRRGPPRSEENTSELQSLMSNTYAVFGLKKK